MSGIRPVSDEVKELAFAKTAELRIYQVHLMAQVIDLAMKRGAFVAAEASQIGALFDSLAGGVNKAYDLAEKELKKTKESELPSISEDKEV